MDMLDDFLCNSSPEEYENSYEEQLWYETEYRFCEDFGVEPEIYED